MPSVPSSRITNALWSLHAVGAALFGIVWVVVLAVTLGKRKPDDNLTLNVVVSFPAWEQVGGNDNETSCFDYLDNAKDNETHFVKCSSTEHIEELYVLDILWLTVSILMLSSLVHLVLAMPKRLQVWDVYINQLVAGINVFRWVDYMLVSPLAIVLVASLVGILDVRMHVLLYFLSSVTAIFGMLGEVMMYIRVQVKGNSKKEDYDDDDQIGARPLRMSLQYGSRPVGAFLQQKRGGRHDEILTAGEKRLLQAIPLLFGLVCQVGVWFTILQTTVLAAEMQDREQPAIIFAIAVVHCVFSFALSTVGVVQASGVSAISCEFAYLVLNLVSRITLGLMVLSGLLVHPAILGELHSWTRFSELE